MFDYFPFRIFENCLTSSNDVYLQENEPMSWIADEDLLNFHLKRLGLLLDDTSVGGLMPVLHNTVLFRSSSDQVAFFNLKGLYLGYTGAKAWA